MMTGTATRNVPARTVLRAPYSWFPVGTEFVVNKDPRYYVEVTPDGGGDVPPVLEAIRLLAAGVLVDSTARGRAPA
jgi:hypothetical protein